MTAAFFYVYFQTYILLLFLLVYKEYNVKYKKTV